MERERDPRRRRAALGLALVGCAAAISLSCAAAAPAFGVAAHTVTVTLDARGKATWSSDGGGDNARLVLTYRWRGTLKLAVPARVLRRPARTAFAVSGSTTLSADWTGVLSGTKAGGLYRCDYNGLHVPGRVSATLGHGARGTLRLVLHPRGDGFFPSRGSGATVSSSSRIGTDGPTHFEPASLFRDALQDHGRFSSDTAVIVVSSALLPHGSVTVTFPSEAGRVDQPLRPKLAWRNTGRLTLRAH